MNDRPVALITGVGPGTGAAIASDSRCPSDVTCVWAGNAEVGEGKMTIAESRPNDLIRVDLQFIKPFAGNSVAEFTFKPQGEQTLVTWAL